MACFHPLTAYRAPPGYQLSGANLAGISFDPRNKDLSGVEVLKLPCGQCIGCRLEKSRQWAMRIVLEQKMHNESCFITLTYNDEYLPANYSLFQEDMTLFVKRLRKWIDSVIPGRKIRYFYCGEYGAKSSRPHYHMCLFGFDFQKFRKFYKFTKNGDNLWISEQLENLWGKGFCPFGNLTFDSAAYTARYILKKINGPLAPEHYGNRHPEFICMSRRPGIGAEWLAKYGSDLYSKDYIHLRNGLKARPPRYFDRCFKEMHEPRDKSDDWQPSKEYLHFLELKERRKEHAVDNPDNTPERLAQREEIARNLTKEIYKRRIKENVV